MSYFIRPGRFSNTLLNAGDTRATRFVVLFSNGRKDFKVIAVKAWTKRKEDLIKFCAALHQYVDYNGVDLSLETAVKISKARLSKGFSSFLYEHRHDVIEMACVGQCRCVDRKEQIAMTLEVSDYIQQAFGEHGEGMESVPFHAIFDGADVLHRPLSTKGLPC